MDAGREQHFVGVDVADPRDELLIHQRRFELGVALRHDLAEVIPAHDRREGVDPEVREFVDGRQVAVHDGRNVPISRSGETRLRTALGL